MCIVLNSGNVESFYSVTKSQIMTGGQFNDTLVGGRMWIGEMVTHQPPIFLDERGRARDKWGDIS